MRHRHLMAEAKASAAGLDPAAREARQRAALRLACGIDLEAALRTGACERRDVIRRVDRALRRERCNGLTRHWSYDLNRHIALKQALDRLQAGEASTQEGAP